MDRNGNTYTFLYASIMVIVVAAILSAAAYNLKPFQKKNEEVEKMQNILASVNIQVNPIDAPTTYKKTILNTYVIDHKGNRKKGIEAFSVNLKKEHAKPVEQQSLPVFEANIGGEVKYIIPLRGTGLWGAIWGYVAFNNDKNTIFGATFDHEKETPGLGAEISTSKFQSPFTGKKIFDNNRQLVAITIAKPGEQAPAVHKVDGISGGTITSKALEKMLLDGLTGYNAFLTGKTN